ncbi:hypothetical protein CAUPRSCDRAFT_12264, partial [Caulochytrium protostelioides]
VAAGIPRDNLSETAEPLAVVAASTPSVSLLTRPRAPSPPHAENEEDPQNDPHGDSNDALRLQIGIGSEPPLSRPADVGQDLQKALPRTALPQVIAAGGMAASDEEDELISSDETDTHDNGNDDDDACTKGAMREPKDEEEAAREARVSSELDTSGALGDACDASRADPDLELPGAEPTVDLSITESMRHGQFPKHLRHRRFKRSLNRCAVNVACEVLSVARMAGSSETHELTTLVVVIVLANIQFSWDRSGNALADHKRVQAGRQVGRRDCVKIGIRGDIGVPGFGVWVLEVGHPVVCGYGPLNDGGACEVRHVHASQQRKQLSNSEAGQLMDSRLRNSET